MQNKRYEAIERQALAVGGGILNLEIENSENTTVNYHGIRFKGRVITDINDANSEFGSGWITLLCLPPGVSTPTIDSDVDAENFQQFIIATEQFSNFGGGATTNNRNGNGAAACYDFDIVPRTSRNCMKGAKIVAQVVNESVAIQQIVTCVVSTFETTN